MDNIAGIIESVSHLPLFLQALVGFVFFVVFIIVLFFGFGKRWKGLLKIVNEQKDLQHEANEVLEEIPIAHELKSLTDDIDRDTRMRILRRGRAVIFKLLTDYEKTCPLIVYNMRMEFETFFREYIFENHLIKKSFNYERRSESERIKILVKELYENITLLVKSTTCDPKNRQIPDWKEIEGKLDSFIDTFFKILVEEMEGACNEKIFLYENKKVDIKNEKLIKMLCEIPIEKNKTYLEKMK